MADRDGPTVGHPERTGRCPRPARGEKLPGRLYSWVPELSPGTGKPRSLISASISAIATTERAVGVGRIHGVRDREEVLDQSFIASIMAPSRKTPTINHIDRNRQRNDESS